MVCNIAVSMRVVHPSAYTDPRDALSQSWITFLDRCGLSPILVPNRIAVQPFLDRLGIEGVLLTGGNDLCAAAYGATHPDSPDAAPERDATERALIHFALERGIPVVGVCRGMQMINVHFGGSVLPELRTQHPGAGNHVALEHLVTIEPQWARARFGAQELSVNSFHNQGVTEGELAEPLEVLARSVDGVVEALVHRDLEIYGVQWHPERAGSPAAFDEALFRAVFLTRDVRPRPGAG